MAATRLLVFVSGGYTQSRFGQVEFPLPINGAPTAVGLAKNTYDGWFVGAGYEYGLGLLPGLFWKTEYRFADYGKESVNILVGRRSGWSVDRIAQIRPDRAQRAGLALQLRRSGGRVRC